MRSLSQGLEISGKTCQKEVRQSFLSAGLSCFVVLMDCPFVSHYRMLSLKYKPHRRLRDDALDIVELLNDDIIVGFLGILYTSIPFLYVCEEASNV